ncbi:lipocalin family protein [Kaistia defluvii]|uniref:lipocalin family protein n=1 Tax=Kaistia defluvii TaxID=410841 RepID=UPI002255C5F9|nr:lipocalin family protein [Kaistia defluvii]MCX5518951.1 lipocalin family protein [Kaistia defluvii]
MTPGRILPLFAACLLAACGPSGPVGNAAVPPPAKSVEIERYLGRWFELGRYENGFERGCEAVTADYSLRRDGLVTVVNTCRAGGIDGKARVAVGRARVVAGSGNAKFKVSFFGPFLGDYWVLDHAPDYAWSIVGEGSGRYLRILTRTPTPSGPVRRCIESRVRSLGYDVSMVRWTRH